MDPEGDGAITTVWDWLNRLNAANFAGHNDWRLPSEGGHNSPRTGSNELETILQAANRCAPHPCSDPIFGPPAFNFYWSASSCSCNPISAWFVNLSDGFVGYANFKRDGHCVRAVR